MSGAKSDYIGGGLAATSASLLHIWKPSQSCDGYKDISVAIGASSSSGNGPSSAVAWNRNNKVIAVGNEGSVQLRYSNGDIMSTLTGSMAGQITSLSWSLGSKKLAAGSRNGNVYVHDMTTKTSKTLRGNGSSSPISAVCFHPDDKFLATASDVVTVYNPNLERVGSLTSTSETSQKSCLTVAAAQPLIAAGSEDGALTVWDCKTKQVVHEQLGRHLAGTVATEFVPLNPSLLVSAGGDGQVYIQDRRSSSFSSPDTIIDTAAAISSMSIKEDYSLVAVGTESGMILLYDPRNPTTPVHTLRCSGGYPVSSLHWQHNYQSLSLKTKESVTAQQQPQQRVTRFQEPIATALGATSSTSITSTSEQQEQQQQQQQHGGRSTTAITTNNSSRAAAQQQMPSCTTSASQDDSMAVSLEAVSPAEVQRRVSLPASVSATATAAENAVTTNLQTSSAPRSGNRQLTITPPHEPMMPIGEEMERVDSPSNPNEQRWAIPAVTPGTRLRPHFLAVDNNGDENNNGGQRSILKSPTKTPLQPINAGNNNGSSIARDTALEAPAAAHSLRDDILALHLDMLTQFQEQQAANTALINSVMERQDQLAKQVESLQRNIQDMMQRRGDVLWL